MAHRGLTRTLFTTEIHATAPGYDFAGLKDMLAWRDTIMTTCGSNHRWRGETASAHGYHQHGFGRIVAQSLPQASEGRSRRRDRGRQELISGPPSAAGMPEHHCRSSQQPRQVHRQRQPASGTELAHSAGTCQCAL